MPEKKSLLGCWREMRATLKKQEKQPNYQSSMPLPIKAHPGVTKESSINKMQKKSDQFHTSIENNFYVIVKLKERKGFD